MPSRFDKLAFDTTQAARVSWYFGQKLLAARMSRPVPLPERAARPTDAEPAAHSPRSAGADRAGLAQYRGRILCAAGRRVRQPACGGSPRRRFFRRSRRGRGQAPWRAQGALTEPAPIRELPAIFPAKISFSERRVFERGVGRALRPPGRGIVRRRGRGDAPPGAGAAQTRARRPPSRRAPHRAAVRPRLRNRALFTRGKGELPARCTSPGSICRRITSLSPGASWRPGRAPASSKAPPKRCRSPTESSLSSPASTSSMSCRREFVGPSSARSGAC